MSEMMDRVIDAICDAYGAPPANAFLFTAQARAAIAAMREPTEAMLRASYGGIALRDDLMEAWHIMIDEALRE